LRRDICALAKPGKTDAPCQKADGTVHKQQIRPACLRSVQVAARRFGFQTARFHRQCRAARAADGKGQEWHDQRSPLEWSGDAPGPAPSHDRPRQPQLLRLSCKIRHQSGRHSRSGKCLFCRQFQRKIRFLTEQQAGDCPSSNNLEHAA
jgi:hypothetical protein